MAVFGKFYVDALLCMAVLLVSYRGITAQNMQCATKAMSCLTQFQSAITGKDQNDKDALCSGVSNYLTCTENVLKECGSQDNDMLDKARKDMEKYECSGAGLPVISMLCLVVAALFHVIY
ncbi:uncharacterized protein LOC125679404 [Ostrea edulis]|uniref:uncharacterized protein LOC125679404 n=1 Tax=Ostrea edulis TaxID=37623 RepID=UPI0020946D58|nr:uncharacterized protein LOC125679404 [Ostrea edulis]